MTFHDDKVPHILAANFSLLAVFQIVSSFLKYADPAISSALKLIQLVVALYSVWHIFDKRRANKKANNEKTTDTNTDSSEPSV